MLNIYICCAKLIYVNFCNLLNNLISFIWFNIYFSRKILFSFSQGQYFCSQLETIIWNFKEKLFSICFYVEKIDINRIS